MEQDLDFVFDILNHVQESEYCKMFGTRLMKYIRDHYDMSELVKESKERVRKQQVADQIILINFPIEYVRDMILFIIYMYSSSNNMKNFRKLKNISENSLNSTSDTELCSDYAVERYKYTFSDNSFGNVINRPALLISVDESPWCNLGLAFEIEENGITERKMKVFGLGYEIIISKEIESKTILGLDIIYTGHTGITNMILEE